MQHQVFWCFILRREEEDAANYTCCLTACIHALFFISFLFGGWGGGGMYSIMPDERDYSVFATLITVSFKAVLKCYNCNLPPVSSLSYKRFSYKGKE